MGRTFRSKRRLALPQITSAVITAVLCLYGSGLPLPSSTSVANNVHAIVRPNEAVYTQPVIKPTLIRPQRPDCYAKPCLALTFDDGPNAQTTPAVLSTLEANHVTASFFVIGKKIAGNEQLLQRMYADGDEIGNHSWDHPDFTKLTAIEMSDELARTQAAITSAGVPAPHYFRPPYGAINQTVITASPLQLVLWNEDPVDWSKNDPAQITAAVIAAAKPGGVVDLHDIYPSTAAALQPILDALKDKYQFVTISQLLHSRDRPDKTPFFGYQASLFDR